MDINALVAIFVFAIGLCIGSFLNVVAIRGLSGESIVFPPSKCPKCGKRLNWYTNIPIVSYVFLLGKCQFCREPISLQYPVVEAANAILYTFLYLTCGITLKTLLLCAVSSIFILICITDFKEQVVLDVHTYILIALGLLYNILHLGSTTISESILGLIAGYLIFEFLAHLGTLFVKTRAFGEGDSLIAMGLGALLGLKMLILCIFLSLIVQAFFAIPMLFVKYLKNRNFLGAAAIFAAACGIILLELINPQGTYYIVQLSIICAILLLCLFVILRNLKNKTSESFFYMPFGPAMVVSALLVIFFSRQIVAFFIG